MSSEVTLSRREVLQTQTSLLMPRAKIAETTQINPVFHPSANEILSVASMTSDAFPVPAKSAGYLAVETPTSNANSPGRDWRDSTCFWAMHLEAHQDPSVNTAVSYHCYLLPEFLSIGALRTQFYHQVFYTNQRRLVRAQVGGKFS